jgi:hypothetical protein
MFSKLNVAEYVPFSFDISVFSYVTAENNSPRIFIKFYIGNFASFYQHNPIWLKLDNNDAHLTLKKKLTCVSELISKVIH